MARRLFTWLDQEFEGCDCMCHTIGMGVMHCFPCCSLCYEQYLNNDGTINDQALEKVLSTRYAQSKENG
jgi:hypothetical protein